MRSKAPKIKVLPPLMTNRRDGTISFRKGAVGEAYGFGSSEPRVRYEHLRNSSSNESLNINEDLIRVAADKVQELEINRSSLETLGSQAEKADRYLSYKRSKDKSIHFDIKIEKQFNNSNAQSSRSLLQARTPRN